MEAGTTFREQGSSISLIVSYRLSWRMRYGKQSMLNNYDDNLGAKVHLR